MDLNGLFEMVARDENEPPFDHGAWWAVQVEAPPADAVQDVFRFVRLHHPLAGCATGRTVRPVALLRRSVGEAAKHADAVTFRCVEVLGHTLEGVAPIQAHSLNGTAVGNLAFIACHHSQARVRAMALAELERLRGELQE